MFQEEFDKLSKGDQAQFRSVLNNLLYDCYIVRRVYDRASNMNKISPDYLFIERHFDTFVDYLSYGGMEISKDDDAGVIFLTSEDETNRIRIDGITTLIIYALRSYYEGKIKDNPSVNEIYIDATQLKILLKDLGITSVTKRISSSAIASSLRTLALYNIVVIAQHSFSDLSYAFYILPSIRYIISNAKLNALYNAIAEIGADNPKADVAVDALQENDEATTGETEDVSSGKGGAEK
jgi:hypothetical protein